MKINEKNYKEPIKLYNLEKDKAFWPEDAEDWLWWSSEADEWAEDYAKSYRAKISPYDFLDLTTEKGASNLNYGDMFLGGELRDLDIDEFNKEKLQPMFLQIVFRDENRPNLAQVIGHEGRHRMFALMKAGIKEVDIELRCDVYDTNYKKYKPFNLDYIILKGQFNPSVRVTIKNPIPMSWKKHKEMRPGLGLKENYSYNGINFSFTLDQLYNILSKELDGLTSKAESVNHLLDIFPDLTTNVALEIYNKTNTGDDLDIEWWSNFTNLVNGEDSDYAIELRELDPEILNKEIKDLEKDTFLEKKLDEVFKEISLDDYLKSTATVFDGVIMPSGNIGVIGNEEDVEYEYDPKEDIYFTDYHPLIIMRNDPTEEQYKSLEPIIANNLRDFDYVKIKFDKDNFIIFENYEEALENDTGQKASDYSDVRVNESGWKASDVIKIIRDFFTDKLIEQKYRDGETEDEPYECFQVYATWVDFEKGFVKASFLNKDNAIKYCQDNDYACVERAYGYDINTKYDLVFRNNTDKDVFIEGKAHYTLDSTYSCAEVLPDGKLKENSFLPYLGKNPCVFDYLGIIQIENKPNDKQLEEIRNRIIAYLDLYSFVVIKYADSKSIKTFENENSKFSEMLKFNDIYSLTRTQKIDGVKFTSSEIIKDINNHFKDLYIEEIVKKGNKWQVQSEKGKNLGTYDTKKEAENRLKQVHYFKHINEDKTADEIAEEKAQEVDRCLRKASKELSEKEFKSFARKVFPVVASSSIESLTDYFYNHIDNRESGIIYDWHLYYTKDKYDRSDRINFDALHEIEDDVFVEDLDDEHLVFKSAKALYYALRDEIVGWKQVWEAIAFLHKVFPNVDTVDLEELYNIIKRPDSLKKEDWDWLNKLLGEEINYDEFSPYILRNYVEPEKDTFIENLSEELLLEKTRNQLIDKSKKSDKYKSKGRENENRWTRRTKSRIANTVKDYNRIDMDAFFKADILDFVIKVKGETNDYEVTITFEEALREIAEQIKRNNNKLEFKCVLRGLISAFNRGNVYVGCSCLHPDTRIKLLDGTTPTVAEMKDRFDDGEQLYVYSTDEKGDFKPGVVEKVWITKKESNLIKITLDNGKSIITTLDHPYMLRDCNYKLAEELSVGQSLMPMYFNYSANGYETVKFNSEQRGWHSIYKLVSDYFKSNEIEEAKLRVNPNDNMPYDVAIHHKDFNKNNNNPDNLQIMTAKEHWSYHNSLTWENKPEEMKEHIRQKSRENAIKRNANPTEKMLECRKIFIEKGHKSAEFRNHDPECLKKQSELMRKTMKEYYKNISEEDRNYLHSIRSKKTKEAFERGCFKTEKFKKAALERGKQMHTPEREALIRAGIRRYRENMTDEEKAKRYEISANNIKKAQEAVRGKPKSSAAKKRMSEARLNESPEHKQQRINRCFDKKVLKVLLLILANKEDITEDTYTKYWTSGIPGINKVKEHYGSLNEAVSYFKLNHKITNIEYITLEQPIDVYDIKVKDWENFVVDAGVVLHNCPDFKYRQQYWATRGQYNSISPQPSNGKMIANPDDTKGAGCKHVNLCLANLDWMMKIASVINNYIYWARDNLEMQYAKFIFPVIYGMPYDKAIQMTLDMYDEEGELKPEYADDTLRSDVDIINMSNMIGRQRGQYKKKPEKSVNPRYADVHPKKEIEEPESNELGLEFDNEEPEFDIENN